MARIGTLTTDGAKEQSGVWKPWLEDTELLIARWNTTAQVAWWQEEEVALVAENASKLVEPDPQLTVITPDQQLELTKRAMAKFVLLGWRNLQEDDGTEIEYSEERALVLFELDGFGSKLCLFVLQQARKDENYRKAYLEELQGNSSSA